MEQNVYTPARNAFDSDMYFLELQDSMMNSSKESETSQPISYDERILHVLRRLYEKQLFQQQKSAFAF